MRIMRLGKGSSSVAEEVQLREHTRLLSGKCVYVCVGVSICMCLPPLCLFLTAVVVVVGRDYQLPSSLTSVYLAETRRSVKPFPPPPF